MKHKLGVSVAIIVIALVVFFAVNQLTTPNVLSKNDITTQIEKSYQGDILSIVEEHKTYIASFTKEGSVFEVTIDRENGQFSHLTTANRTDHRTKTGSKTSRFNRATSHRHCIKRSPWRTGFCRI